MVDSLPPDPASPRKRWRVLWICLGVIAALLVAGAVIGAVRFDTEVNRFKDKQLAELSKQLGRPVRVGKIDTHLLALSVDVTDVEVSADPERPAEKVPVMTLGRLHVAVAGKTLWSLGKRPGLSELSIEGLTVNIVKHPDGTLNVLNLADKLPKDEKPEPPSPPNPENAKRMHAATLDDFKLASARVRFIDLSRGGATVEIGQIDIAVPHASLSDPTTVTMSAAMLAPSKNFNLRALLGPAGQDPSPPLEELTIKLDRTDLSPLTPFLAAAVPDKLSGLESATLAIDIEARPGAAAPGGKGPTSQRNSIALTGLKFSGGQPFDVGLQSEVAGDFTTKGSETLDIQKFLLAIGPMALEAHGKLAALTGQPRFSDVVVQSRGFDFDTLRKLVPDVGGKGVNLHGPFSLELRAGGSQASQTFKGAFDLTTASIEVPKTLRKPAGTPLRFDVEGTLAGDALELQRLGFQIADWRLVAKGTVHKLGSDAPLLALTAAAEAPGLAGLLRLLPPVAAGLGPKAKLDGSLAIDAKVAGTPQALHAELDANLSRLAVKVPDARLGGGGTLAVVADQKGKALDAKVSADFTALEAFYLDQIRKAAGVPLTFTVTAKKRDDDQDVQLAVRAAELKVDGHATMQKEAMTAQVNIPTFRVRSLTAMLPSLSEAPLGDIHAGAKLSVKGRNDVPSSIEAKVEDLVLTAGKSDLHGRLTVDNPERPKVDMEARSAYLDLDDFVPPSNKPKPKDEKKTEPGALDKVTGRVRLDVARGKAAGIDYKDLHAELTLAGGRAIARQLEVAVFGGKFSGSGTEISPLDDQAPFKAKGALSDVDVNEVVSHFAGVPNLVKGRLTADIGLDGNGTAPQMLAKSLDGLISGRIDQGEFLTGALIEGLIGPIAGKVNALPGAGKLIDTSSAPVKRLGDRAVSQMQAIIKVTQGAAVLSKPLLAQTSSGPLQLDGRVLLAGQWDLKGLLSLTPAAASALTGNRVTFDQPVPVRLTITGPIAHPKVAPAAVDEVAKTFAVAFAKSAAGRAIKDQVGAGAGKLLEKTGLGDKIPGGAPASVDDAKAKAQAQVAEQQAKAQAESDRLKAEAEAARKKAEDDARARAEAAKKNAGDQAKEKLKGLFGR